MVEGPIGAAAFSNEFGRPGLGGFFRVYEQTVDGVRRGFHKPIMSAGGLGTIGADMTEKVVFPAGTLLAQIGGPGMRIGMGGGAASSMAAGANAAELDTAAKALDGKVQTLFRGETLRGLLLTSYGFSIFGERAAQAALVAYAVALILFLASIAGFIHAFTTSKDEVVLTAHESA